jgi:hypothetical protein
MLKRFPSALGDFLYVSNRHELIWGGLPWILPNVRTAPRTPDRNSSLAEFFSADGQDHPGAG